MKSPELMGKVHAFKLSDGGPKNSLGEAIRRQKKVREMAELIKKMQGFLIGLQGFRTWVVEQIEGPNEYEPFQLEIFKTVLEKFDAAPDVGAEEKT